MQQDWQSSFFSGIALEAWWWAVTPECTESDVAFLASALNVQPRSRILNVPCGNGRHSILFAKGGARVTGIDLAEENITEARRLSGAVEVEWRISDMRDLPGSLRFGGGENKSMSTPAWTFQYSIETDAHPEFAWLFWTNVSNWRELEPGVEFELDGPFAAGTRGRTRMPGEQPRHWLIRTVDPGRSWTQEISLPGASFMVTMQFEEVGEGRTRITQRLEGDAEPFLDAARLFETTTPDGLKRIAAIIERAQREARALGC